ncbi:MAG TPA: AAA family ATPase [Nitrososphaeraceae archaeon]|jgi:dephospho-CoA kinase|nr:AAA family ATPase [Nitrososphaeraceae archaeon]
MSEDILIVALTGMPGAGKTTVANFLAQKGIPLLIMGDVVREAAQNDGLEPTSDNLSKLMLRLREKNGPEAIAYLVADKIESMKHEKKEFGVVIVDGIRSMAEIQVLNRVGKVKLLAIHGSTSTRYSHIRERARSDVPSNIGEFDRRDEVEMRVGISDAIALADETISNNDISISELCNLSLRIVQRWMGEKKIKLLDGNDKSCGK